MKTRKVLKTYCNFLIPFFTLPSTRRKSNCPQAKHQSINPPLHFAFLSMSYFQLRLDLVPKYLQHMQLVQRGVWWILKDEHFIIIRQASFGHWTQANRHTIT